MSTQAAARPAIRIQVPEPPPARGKRWLWPAANDPRIPFALILTVYAVIGCIWLRFNRTPGQILLTVAAACLFDMALSRLLRGERLVPLSAYITGASLALLLNYSHNYYLLFLPVYLAVGSKFLLTYEGRHVFNPSLFGVAVSLLIGGDLISTAPAYQWGGTWAMSAFMVMTALCLFFFKIGRSALIISFLASYVLQILARAWIMRWYLPPEALVFGTLTSAPFFLFVFYMITDPKTSPSSRAGQVALGIALTLVDMAFHAVTSLYTFFYAAFTVAVFRFVFLHARKMWRDGAARRLRDLYRDRGLRRAAGVLALAGLAMAGVYRGILMPRVTAADVNFRLAEIPTSASGLDARLGDVLTQVDPRVQHIAKWVLSAGDAVAAADYDQDGRLDLFLTNPLKRPEDRNALYRNLGGFRFERVELPALHAVGHQPAEYGISGSATFVDYDNDGDQDLFLAMGYGKCILLRNRLAETGAASFDDVTASSNIDEYTISIAANFFDYDRDGRLDLIIANALNPLLEQYNPPRRLNIFRLPAPEFPGDRRMLPFMHSSWDDARNGGLNALYRNLGNGRFEKKDIRAWGMPQTHWSLAIATGDLNNDGWPDLYMANDFGPDDLYLNEQGRHFRHIQGRVFGSISRDSYKGMNASLADIDRNGFLDIYISNVHVPLQAEGSLLWMTYPNPREPFVPRFEDEATQRGALNEHRFGWGGALGDLNNDGWLDILQANGMVDDTPDKRFERCRSYWYVNEKLMRSGPEIHTYADMWGDLRGYCINGREANRVYLSRGPRSRLQFVDVAPEVGWTEKTNSRGVLLADLDNDGDLDAAVTHQFAPVSLYRNTLYEQQAGGTSAGGPRWAGRPHWVGFALKGDGSACNRDAAGSRISIRYQEGGRAAEQMREVAITNAFAAQGDRRILFGLGDATEAAVEATVSWCGGAARSYGRFAAGQYHTIAHK